ncbi:glycerophosphodiester phosphodiesterase [Nocardioides cheoyonin]|uniref:glycerophosphodiester phosphodiesterase n=1 Tax=Nocardioides cheoyonin TaxID=3156615 RepID=UPI0032B5B1B2
MTRPVTADVRRRAAGVAAALLLAGLTGLAGCGGGGSTGTAGVSTGPTAGVPTSAGPIPLVSPGCTGLAIGHRGASEEAPEDTLPSERRSARLGSDYLELDLHLTADGVPVVLHDDTVDRTTDGTGPVSDLTLAQVERLDAGSWFSARYAGTRVPTFEQVLRFAKRSGADLMPELKAGWDRSQVAIVVDLVKRYGLESRTVFQSFDPKALAYADDLDPAIARAGLVDKSLPSDPVAWVGSFDGQALLPAYDLVTADLVETMHDAGIAVVPWTVDNRADWDRLRSYGVDGIMSNDTAGLIRWTRAHAC